MSSSLCTCGTTKRPWSCSWTATMPICRERREKNPAMPRNGSLHTGGAGSMPKGSGDGRAQVCRYGAWFLSRVALEFREEIEVVKEGRDVEAVHRMRVTSRRLRAGLPLFSQCFPGKAYKKISGGIRRIT